MNEEKSHFELTGSHKANCIHTSVDFYSSEQHASPAFTSALEAITYGSTQLVLVREPRGKHYNKAG